MKKITITDKFYVLAMPDDSNTVYEFWLFHKDYGVATMMFGCKVESEADIAALAENKAPEYFELLFELAGESDE